MDIGGLETIITGQEVAISQLEQELHQLQSAQRAETGAGSKEAEKINRKIFLESEVEKLRLANDKLRYRINILKLATAEELSQAAGEKD